MKYLKLVDTEYSTKKNIITSFGKEVVIGYLYQEVDGFYVLQLPDGGGCISSNILREIADLMDELNKDWDEYIKNWDEDRKDYSI